MKHSGTHSLPKPEPKPSLHLYLSKPAYRPGECVLAFVDVNHGFDSHLSPPASESTGDLKRPFHQEGKSGYILMENLEVEVKGIEKLDPNWIKFNKGSPFQKGERLILKSLPISISSDALIQNGTAKSYHVKFTLPKILPPSYKGISVKYHYFLSTTLTWSFVPLTQEKNIIKTRNSTSLNKSFKLEHRIPIKIWTRPECSGLREEEIGDEDYHGVGGIVPQTALEVELQWKERNLRSSWSFFHSSSEEDDGYSQSCADVSDSDNLNADSSLQYDDFTDSDSQSRPNQNSNSNSISRIPQVSNSNSVSNSNAFEPSLNVSALDDDFRGKLKAQKKLVSNLIKSSYINASVTSPPIFDPLVSEEERDEMEVLEKEREKEIEQSFLSISRHRSSFMYKPKNTSGLLFSENSLFSRLPNISKSLFPPSSPIFRDHSFNASRGKTFNIRVEDQILVRFSPRDPNLSYSLGDSVSGTLSFPRDENGTGRRCMEVSVFLETHELINPKILNPSSGLPQIHTEFHEITGNLLSTYFIFSIPMDAPAAFATPIVSLQWLLRFEFVYTTPQNNSNTSKRRTFSIDVKNIERGEWSIPITVTAPLPRVPSSDGFSFLESHQDPKP